MVLKGPEEQSADMPENAEATVSHPAHQVCSEMTIAELLDNVAPKGGSLNAFRKDVQDALLVEITNASGALVQNSPNVSSEPTKKAVIISVFSEMDIKKVLEAWRIFAGSQPSDLLIVKDSSDAAQLDKLDGCLGTHRLSDSNQCFVLAADSVPWSSYEVVLFSAGSDQLPKAFVSENVKLPVAMKTHKPITSKSAKSHLQWVAGKQKLLKKDVGFEDFDIIFLHGGSTGKAVFHLHRLVRRWLEWYEFSRFEKTATNGDEYWPWTRRNELANSIVGNFLEITFVELERLPAK